MNGVKVQITYKYHRPKPALIDYIYHQNEKGKPGETDLPLLKYDNTTFLSLQKPVFHCEIVEKAIFEHAVI